MNYLEKFQGWLMGKVQAASDATTLPPSAPSPSVPSHTPTPAPTPIEEFGQLPNTLAEVPDPAIEEDYSTASVWAQILCGNGKVRSQRVRSAAELEKKRLNGAREGFEKRCGLRLD